MRIIELRPELTPHKVGKTHRASSWRAEDDDRGGQLTRDIWHYSTRMIRFTSEDGGETWSADVVSVGHGSVSDQNGVNQLTSVRYNWQTRTLHRDYGWRYSRRGGASVEYVGPETAVSVADVIATWPVLQVTA